MPINSMLKFCIRIHSPERQDAGVNQTDIDFLYENAAWPKDNVPRQRRYQGIHFSPNSKSIQYE
jgi:hypothetical protein